tara:strand:+ start:1005 stop:2423 length:1419 start_codon:yes stop_codon:yes gene_type:complete
MDSYDKFKEQIKLAAEEFKKIDKNETIRLISHLDADGISAAAIFIKMLNNENRKYSLSIIQQLNHDVLDELKLEKHKYFVFTDLGCGTLSGMGDKLKDRKIFVLDHHNPEEVDVPENVVAVNPHYFDIDGGKEISGAGVTYLFCRAVDEKIEDFAHIAVIGAIGDIQEQGGFLRLNEEIKQTAIKRKKLEVRIGLRLFGAQTRPLHKALEYCTDPYIPGVSGSESGAVQFLYQIGIEPKTGNKWKKAVHLDEDDMKKLVTGIVMRRLGESTPEDVLGDVYLLTKEKEESPTKDAKEFATLLNACGRMGKASLGIGACLGDEKIMAKALRNLIDYRKQIINAINWYYDNKKSKHIMKGEGFTIINARDQVMPTIIGTLASILSKSNGFDGDTYILSLAQVLDGTTKVSIRFAGRKDDLDLREVINSITNGIDGCESGGHHFAAGALIPTAKEGEFLESAKNHLGKIGLEENVG